MFCGECTFLKESQDGLGGLCAHPEKDPYSKVEVQPTIPSNYRKYEDECRHEFPDIWAARGSARLIWNEQRKDPLLQYKKGGI